MPMKPWIDLAARFRFHTKELSELCSSFDADQWQQRLHPEIDPPLFALGHLAATRRKMLRRMGHDMSLEAWEAAFSNGCLEDEPDDCPSPSEMLEDFQANGELLAASLEEMTFEDGRVCWGGRTPDGAQTLCGMLGFLSADEARHLGRLQLLRELLRTGTLAG